MGCSEAWLTGFFSCLAARIQPWRNLGAEVDISKRAHLKPVSSPKGNLEGNLSSSGPFKLDFLGRQKSKLGVSSLAQCVSYFIKKARRVNLHLHSYRT